MIYLLRERNIYGFILIKEKEGGRKGGGGRGGGDGEGKEVFIYLIYIYGFSYK